MHSFIGSIVFALAAGVPMCVAAQPLKPVGTVSIDMDDRAHARKFTSELWFEGAPGSKVEDFVVRPPLRAIGIARDAQPASGLQKRPLIVVSHGNWGTRYSQGWLAMRLVGAGYVVLSTSHPGTLGDDQTAAGRLRLWDRSRDVSFALTRVLEHPKWAALVDEKRIGFAGHSFGGWTGVSLAGGRYDPARQRGHCEAAPTKDFYCDGTLKDDIAGVQTNDAAGSFKDVRFRAFYLMAAGPGQGFTDASLAAIDVPFVVDTAAADEVLEAASNSSALARRIPNAKEIVRPVGHFAYVPLCKPLIGPLLARAAGTPICDDPSGVDRALLHQQVADEVIEFFNRQLAPTTRRDG
jgi:predicted dienelactone hydrolase